MKKTISTLMVFAAFLSFTSAQIANNVIKKKEFSVRTSLLNKFNPKNTLYYTKYSKDFKTAWQHSASISTNQNTVNINNQNTFSKIDNYNSIPNKFKNNTNTNLSLGYSISKLYNIPMFDKVWFSHGPGIGLNYSYFVSNQNNINNFYTTNDSFVYNQLTKTNNITNTISPTLMYTAYIKYAITSRIIIGVNVEYTAYFSIYNRMNKREGLKWVDNSFVSDNSTKNVNKSFTSNFSTIPQSSFVLSVMF
jgi:hypothetical protein